MAFPPSQLLTQMNVRCSSLCANGPRPPMLPVGRISGHNPGGKSQLRFVLPMRRHQSLPLLVLSKPARRPSMPRLLVACLGGMWLGKPGNWPRIEKSESSCSRFARPKSVTRG